MTENQIIGIIVTLTGYFATLYLIRWVLLLKKRQPVSTVAWILTIVFIPFLGSLLFLIFGINRVERRAALKQEATLEIQEELPTIDDAHLAKEEDFKLEQKQLIRVANEVSDTKPTIGNQIEILTDTNKTLGLIEQAILSAKETIHLEYYIWQPDKTGTRLRDMLVEKAKEGVEIRFLYDGIGSLRLSRQFLKVMIDAGIQVYPFLPGTNFGYRWSINLRSHRKIVVVDGKTGFTGGMNIGDEYIGKNPKLGYWRDTHLKITGPAVHQLQQIFLEDWYCASDEMLLSKEHFPNPEITGNSSAQIIGSGPVGDHRAFDSIMFAAINEAKESIHLATSYFVPPINLACALETAAMRGVKVRLLLAGNSAHKITTWAGRSYFEDLLKAGVEIYEYQRGLLHSKTLTMDGHWSLIGSPNFDARSLILNFEVGVVMYDEEIAQQIEGHFRDDLRFGKAIHLKNWQSRPVRKALLENICRIFSPIL